MSATTTKTEIPQSLNQLNQVFLATLPARFGWLQDFQAATQSGADLSQVWPKFALWLLTDSELLAVTDRNRAAIEGVASLYRRVVAGESVSSDEWRAADKAAWRAARPSSHGTAWAHAKEEKAACSAAYMAAAADESMNALRRCADYAARNAAWSFGSSGPAYARMADKLLCLLREASN